MGALRAEVLTTLLLCAAIVAPAPWANAPRASAQTREPPSDAVDYYQSGRDHYSHGRYEEAARDLELALELDPGSLTLVYNLARVYELLGDLDRAIDYYDQYQQILPRSETAELERTSLTLQRLRGAVASRPPDAPPLPVAPPPTEDDERMPRYVTEHGVADLPFWVTLSSGAALTLLGGVLGAVALGRDSDADDFVLGLDGTWEQRDAEIDGARSMALAADVLLITGVATLVTSAMLYLFRARTVEELPSATVALDRHSAMVLWRGSL